MPHQQVYSVPTSGPDTSSPLGGRRGTGKGTSGHQEHEETVSEEKGEKIWGTGDQSEGEGKGIWKGGPFVGKLTGWNIIQRRPTRSPFRLPHPVPPGLGRRGPAAPACWLANWRSFRLFPDDACALQSPHAFSASLHRLGSTKTSRPSASLKYLWGCRVLYPYIGTD